MKKIVLLLILILLCGCEKKVIEEESPSILDNNSEEETLKEEIYVDDNPIKIAFFNKQNGIYKRIDHFESHVEDFKEIGIFSIILSNEDSMSGSIKSLYKEISDTIPNFSNYKIGFNIKFTTTDGKTINENILKPLGYGNYDFSPYLYAWIYDDVNTSGWHSHIEEDEFNDNTIMSSIKLMWGTTSSEINSDIELTVFTYDLDDFDELNNYRGISKFTTIIERS